MGLFSKILYGFKSHQIIWQSVLPYMFDRVLSTLIDLNDIFANDNIFGIWKTTIILLKFFFLLRYTGVSVHQFNRTRKTKLVTLELLVSIHK